MNDLIAAFENLRKNYNEANFESAWSLFKTHNEDLHCDFIRSLFCNQPKAFYIHLGSLLANDLEDNPIFYFFTWEELLSAVDESDRNSIYEGALIDAEDTDVEDYVLGFKAMEEDDFENAARHFDRIEHPIARYFGSECYFNLGNLRNAILQSEIFIKEIEEILENANEEANGFDVSQQIPTLLIYFHMYSELGYAYSQLNEHAHAVNAYKKLLNAWRLEEIHKAFGSDDAETGSTEVMLTNMLIAAKATREYAWAIPIAEFAHELYPNKKWIRKYLNRFRQGRADVKLGDELINQALIAPPSNGKRAKNMAINISREEFLEELILNQLALDPNLFGDHMLLWQSEARTGQQYILTNEKGRVDLLLKSQDNNALVAVELKRGAAGLEVLEQISNYLEALRLEFPDHNVSGVVCVHACDAALLEGVDSRDDVALFVYSVGMERRA